MSLLMDCAVAICLFFFPLMLLLRRFNCSLSDAVEIIPGSASSASSVSTTSLDTLYTPSSASDAALPTAASSPATTPPPVPSRSVHTTITRNLDTGPAAHSRYTSSPKDGASKSPQAKRAAPAPPSDVGTPRSHAADGEKTLQGKKAAPVAPANLEAFSNLCLDDKKAAVAEPMPPEPSGLVASVPKTIGAELIELVRRNTHLSYELSRVAIGVVIGHIQTLVPATSGIMEQILISVVESKVTHVGLCWLAGAKGRGSAVSNTSALLMFAMGSAGRCQRKGAGWG